MSDEQFFGILDGLRASGTMNMFGAPRYLQDHFGLSKEDANRIFSLWTKRYQ